MFKRTISLKEESAKKVTTAEEAEKIEAWKAKVKADKEAKEIRVVILPEDLFKLAPEYAGLYSRFKVEEIPTRLVKDGAELTKSAMKKLAKEKKKHNNVLERYNKIRSSKLIYFSIAVDLCIAQPIYMYMCMHMYTIHM